MNRLEFRNTLIYSCTHDTIRLLLDPSKLVCFSLDFIIDSGFQFQINNNWFLYTNIFILLEQIIYLWKDTVVILLKIPSDILGNQLAFNEHFVVQYIKTTHSYCSTKIFSKPCIN